MSKRKQDKIVYFKFEQKDIPIIKIKEQKDQIVIAFIPLEGTHITLHVEKDAPILCTASSKHKFQSSLDVQRVELARRLGYKNPERHGQYISHAELWKCANWSGYYLGATSIKLSEITKVRTYNPNPDKPEPKKEFYVLQRY